MKDILTEKRTIYREPTTEWMKPRIKSMIQNIRKKKKIQSEQQEEKESKKQGYVKEPLRQLQMYQHLNNKGPTRRRERTRN